MNFVIVRSVTAGLLIFFTAFSVSAAPIVTLKQNSWVNHKYILLGDIADINASSNVAKQLTQVRLSLAPRSTTKKTLRQTDIKSHIQHMYPTLRLVWHGPKVISVTAHTKSLDLVPFIEQAKHALKQQLMTRFDQVEIQAQTKNKEIIIPQYIQPNVNISLPNTSDIKQRSVVWLDFINTEGDSYQSIPLWFNVSLHDRVFVASHDIDASTPLTGALFELQYRNISNQPQAAALTKQKLENTRTKKAILAGDIITPKQIETQPDVTKHSWLTVEVTQANILLEVKAKANQDGFIGQHINVRNDTKGPAYKVTITAKNRAVPYDTTI